MVPQSFAQTTPNTQTYFEFLNSPVNMIKNPHARLNTVNTAFGGSGAKGRASGTSELYGLAAHTCSTTAVSSYCELVMNEAKAPFNSANKRCEASILYNGANANLMALSYTPSGGQEVLVPLKAVTGTDYAEGYVELSCSSGTGVWRLKQITAGTTGTIKYGGYYGPSTRTGQVSQAYKVGTVSVSGCSANWASSSAPWASFSAVSNCVYTVTGELKAPATNIPGFIIPNGKPGSYHILANTTLFKSSTNPGTVAYRLTDGTNIGPSQSVGIGVSTDLLSPGFSSAFDYSAPFANLTFQVQASVGGTNTATYYANGKLFDVYFFPASTSTVATVDNQAFNWVDYNPVITASSGTLTNYTLARTQYRRDSDGKLWIRGFLAFTGAPGTWGGPQVSTPGGLTLTSPNTSLFRQAVTFTDAGSNSYSGDIRLGTGVLQIVSSRGTNGAGLAMNNTSPFTWAATDGMDWEVGPLDVAEWRPAPSGLINIDVPVYTVTRLTSGSGTYTPPAGVRWLKVRGAGAGSGGTGSGTSGASSSLSGPGGNTTFGSFATIYGAPASGQGYGPGGALPIISGVTPIALHAGGQGQGGDQSGPITNNYPTGGQGGSSFFGGAGAGRFAAAAGFNGQACGGGGGGAGAPATGQSGAGGGAGSYAEFILANPTGPIAYSIGTGGTAGPAATAGYAGGAGFNGCLEIEEHYTNFTPALASGLLQRLPGAVTSDSTSAMRIEYAHVSASGVVSQESSDWINGNAVITDTSAFALTKNAGGAGLTNCWATILGTPSTAASSSTAAADSTTVNIRTYTNNAYAVQQFKVFCMGPR